MDGHKCPKDGHELVVKCLQEHDKPEPTVCPNTHLPAAQLQLLQVIFLFHVTVPASLKSGFVEMA